MLGSVEGCTKADLVVFGLQVFSAFADWRDMLLSQGSEARLRLASSHRTHLHLQPAHN